MRFLSTVLIVLGLSLPATAADGLNQQAIRDCLDAKDGDLGMCAAVMLQPCANHSDARRLRACLHKLHRSWGAPVKRVTEAALAGASPQLQLMILLEFQDWRSAAGPACPVSVADHLIQDDGQTQIATNACLVARTAHWWAPDGGRCGWIGL